MIQCGKCGNQLPDGSAFCRYCGTPVSGPEQSSGQSPAFCRNCGAQLTGNARFCPKCGAQTASPGTMRPMSAAGAQTPPRQGGMPQGQNMQQTPPRQGGMPQGQNMQQIPPRQGGMPQGQYPPQQTPPMQQMQQMPPMPPGGRSQPYMPKTGPAQPAEKKKKKFGWKRTVAIVLLAVIGFRLISDHIGGGDPGNGHGSGGSGSGHVSGGQSSGGGKTGSGTAGQNGAGTSTARDTFDYTEWYDPAEYALAKSWSSREIASGTLTEDSSTLRAGSASMTIEEGFFPSTDEPGNMEQAGENGSSSGALAARIAKADQTVDYSVDGVTVPLTLYDFEVDGIADDTRMTLEIPIEKPAGGTVGAGWYDPETMTIWPVSFDYDEAAGVARIHATHLSTYCGFPVVNENTRGAMIAYLEDDQLDEVFSRAIGATSLRSDTYSLVHSAQAEDNWDIAIQTADALGTVNLVVGTVSGATDTIGQLENSMKLFDGAGKSYVKNSIGTIGEIMNTNWGRGGSMPGWYRRYHGPAVDVPLTDKLKSVYNADCISNIGTTLNVMNMGLSVFKIYNHAKNGDNTAAAWESAQLAIDRALSVFAEEFAFPAMGVYLVGVGLFAYALDKFYSTALEGRKQVYVKAYTKYYTKGNPEGHYRSGADWVKVISKIMNGCQTTESAVQEIDEEVDRYCYEFWTKFGTAEYLANLMTEDEKIAWGAAGDAGIRPEIKKQISDEYKKDIMPMISNVVRHVNDKNMEKMKEEWKKNYEKLRRKLNRKITVNISDGSVEKDEKSAYAGCIARFAGVHENPYLQNKSSWETTLDRNGRGKISMTMLAHLAVNAGDVMQVVSRTEKDENGEWKVLEEKQFSLFKPTASNPNCIFTGQGPVDDQKLEWFLGDWWETGELIGERVVRVEYDEKKDSVSVRVNDGAECSPPVSDKRYVIGKDGTLVVHGNFISGGDITLIPEDNNHLRMSFNDTERSFVREDEEAKRLKPFLGDWLGDWNGIKGITTLSYRDGHVLERERGADNATDPGIVTDSYDLKGNTLTVYSDSFQGGYVSFTLQDAETLISVSGGGTRLENKLVESANYVQMRTRSAGSSGNPTGSRPPTGVITMPSIIK